MHSIRQVVPLILGIRALSGAAGAVHAEEPAGQMPVLEEIMVTAQRKEESILDASASVTAFSDAALERSKIENLEDLAAYEPSLSVNQVSSGGSNTFVRGVGNEIIGVGTDSAIAMYVDGVYLPRFNTTFQRFVDVERVEVLKGPQGTLYGRNATGGAINIITRRPSAEPDFDASFGYGNYNATELKLAGGGAIVEDRLLGRASLVYAERDNYGYNPYLDERLKGEDVVAGNLSLNWLPAEDVDVLLRYDKTHDDALGASNVRITRGSPLPLPGDPFHINSDVPGTKREFRGDGSSLVVTWSKGDYDLISQTAWRKIKSDLQFETDGTEADGGYFFVDNDSESFSQEFRIQRVNFERLDWTAGAFVFTEDAFEHITVNQPGGVVGVNVIGDLEVFAWAVFAEATYSFTDRLRGTAGLRYSYEEKEHVSTLNIDVFGNQISSAQLPLATGKESWKAPTPRFVLQYDINDDVMAYVSASNGFKSGGYNSVASDEPPVDQEEIWSYEAGLKGRFADDRLQATVAGFFYDYRDLQLRTILPSGGGVDVRNSNAGKAEIMGLEFASQWAPVDPLVLEFSFAWIDSEYTEYDTINPRTGLVESVAGNRLNQSPEFKLHVAANYTWNLGDAGELTFRGEFQHTGKYYFDQFNNEDLAEDGFELINAFLTWRHATEGWAVSVWGRNLDNELHYAQVFGDAAIARAWLATPRTYGVRLHYSL